MKRRYLMSLLIGLMALLAFGSIAQAQDTVTLSYALWDNNQLPAHQQIIDAFEAEHPNIKVEPQVVPWGNYWEKLQTAVAGGDAYDVFWMNGPNFPVYASKGVLMDIQSKVETDKLDLTVYPQSLVDLYSYEDHSYGLPKDFDTIGLYYNKDLFDAAGVAYPTDKWTWDDFSKAAKELTKDGNWGFASTLEDQSGYWNWIFQNKGEVIAADGSKVLIDEPAACDTLKFLYSFVANGESPDGATMASAEPSTQLFPGGKVAMILGGSWLAGSYANAEGAPNIDVAPLPMGQQRATIIHGLSNVIWSKTQHPDEAWEFLKFLGSEKAATILAQSGTVIPAYQGLQQAWVDSIPDMNLQVFIDELEYAVPYPTAAQGMEWNTQVSTVLGDVWAGNSSIDDACTRAAEAANAVLQPQ